MSDKVKIILLGVTALIVGVIGGGGYGMLQVNEMKLKLMSATQEKERVLQSAERLLRMNEAAAVNYSKVLGRLIMAAAAPPLAVPSSAAHAQSQTAPDLPATTLTQSQSAPDLPAGSASAPAAALDPARLIDEMRAILAVRDGLRASLDGVRASMNSEFDALAAELGKAAPDAGKVKQILDALKRNWPRKEKEMEVATRRLLVDLGLLQAPRLLQPAAPAAPAPAPAARE